MWWPQLRNLEKHLHYEMEKETKPKTTFSAIQNILAGIACSFFIIYKVYLTDPKIIKDLGSSYPWFIMGWVIVMFLSAGLSGSKMIQYLVKYAPMIAKALNVFKKDLINGDNKNE